MKRITFTAAITSREKTIADLRDTVISFMEANSIDSIHSKRYVTVFNAWELEFLFGPKIMNQEYLRTIAMLQLLLSSCEKDGYLKYDNGRIVFVVSSSIGTTGSQNIDNVISFIEEHKHIYITW
jgi:hypothetical protein